MTAPTPCSDRSRYPTPYPAGFTLAELLVSVASMAVLMVGIASTIVLTTRTVDDGTNPPARIREAGLGLDLFLQDAACALTVEECTPLALAFTVPDRDGDSQDEAIRYAWSGGPGDAVTREYNNGPAVDFIEDVHQVAVAYDMTSRTETVPGSPNESGEELLMSCVTGPGLTEDVVRYDKWWGEYFKPTLPADAVSWSVTRVHFRARQSGTPDGQTQVQLCRVTGAGGAPTEVLEQVTVSESSLPPEASDFTWYPVAFSSVTDISPEDGLCLLLFDEDEDPTGTCQIQYHGGPVDLPDAAMLTSSDGGDTWVVSPTEALRFMIYGTYATTGEPQTVDRHYVAGLRVILQVGDDASSRLDAGVQMLNVPRKMSGS